MNLDSAVFDKNLSEIQKIIELILGAVLYCNNKVAFIEKMKTLEPSVQTHLMILIESVIPSFFNYVLIAYFNRKSFANRL